MWGGNQNRILAIKIKRDGVECAVVKERMGDVTEVVFRALVVQDAGNMSSG